MKYGDISPCNTLNGEGFRTVIWVSGCNRHPKCKNCQNSKAWSFEYGKEYTKDTEDYLIECLSKPYIRGLSITGGECTDNLESGELFSLIKRYRENNNGSVWAWSGYTYEELIKNPLKKKFIEELDVLVDGEYIPELKDLSRPWGNSSNQRVIDVQKTLEKGEIVLWQNTQKI